jgi:hypothetical protein
MTRVHLEDKGQDLLHFDYDENDVLPSIMNAGPFQGGFYNGCFIMNPEGIKVGNYVQHSKSPLSGIYQLKYPIVRIEKINK